jgi:hypothetical protein
MNDDIDDDEEINNIESLIYCSICHKKNFDIITDKLKQNKLLLELMKSVNYLELIKKCNCKIKNEFTYAHKLCVLLNILYKYETKCEKCKTDYNIIIRKKFNKKKFFYLFLVFIFIYTIHLLVFLFCIFLLFINIILKEYMKSDKYIAYKNIFIFFGGILFVINCFILYFSIIINIRLFKINIYDFIIDIFDVEDIDPKQNKNNIKSNKLLIEFLSWAHLQSSNFLINEINKKYFFYRFYSRYLNEINEFINSNNSDISSNLEKINIINVEDDNHISNIQKNYLMSKNMISHKNNPNFLQINNLFNRQIDEINFSSNHSSKFNNDIDNSNNNIIKQNNNNFLRQNSKNPIHGSVKLNNTLNDFINININPMTSKNINININFSKEKISQIEKISSSKDFTTQSFRRAFGRDSKIGKTALIPKKLMMSNIITEQNFFKRKKRQLQSIKLRRNQLNLKNTQITGNIDEEIDFSSFERMGDGISKGINDTSQKIMSPSGDKNFKYSNFKNKKSFRDADLNVSSSKSDDSENSKNKNDGNISKSNCSNNKRVHFAG